MNAPVITIDDEGSIARANAWLESQDAATRLRFAQQQLPARLVLSSSFGAQAQVSLHLLSEHAPEVAVLLIDTGYLFPETLEFVDALRARLKFRLHVYQPDPKQAWSATQVAELGPQHPERLDQYNRIHKVEPMQRALSELGVGTWISGLRRVQSDTRSNAPVLSVAQGRFKLHPIVDWDERMIFDYIKRHQLPKHPLWLRGYRSIGDRHSSVPIQQGMRAQDTRFFGVKRECGLHSS